MLPNGIIIQQLTNPGRYSFSFPYNGVNAFHQYPLCGIHDPECLALTKEVFSKETNDGYYIQTEFMSSMELVNRYLRCCKKHRIPVRALFIESDYTDEIWTDTIPDMKFLGFEYCSLPFDNQIITDMDWSPCLSGFRSKLNANGLFDSFADAEAFREAYLKRMSEGMIGDGDMDAYIMRVSEVSQKILCPDRQRSRDGVQ